MSFSELEIPGVPIPKPPRPPLRFFLAHAKSCEDEELDELVEVASKILDGFAKGKPFDLVLGRAYFEARFKACGSWNAWVAEVATGLDYTTRRPIFDAIMVPAGPVGAATAAMVRKAHAIRKPMFAFTLRGNHSPIVGVRTIDVKDWKEGYRLVCKRALV
jgi:hypothetical protein